MDSPIGNRGFSDDPGSWNTMPILLRKGLRSRGLAPTMLVPTISRVPPDTGSNPTAARAMVVFRDPDSPTSPTTSPGWIVRSPPPAPLHAGIRPALGGV